MICMNKENLVVTTTKFDELRKELNRHFYQKQDYASDEYFKTLALKETVEKMLILLDELVRE